MLKKNQNAVWGTHGYDNKYKSMHAIFYARGRAFRVGYVMDSFTNVHIYPLIAEILGIEPYLEIDGNLDSVRVMLNDYE